MCADFGFAIDTGAVDAWLSKLAYMSDHDATQNSPETHSLTSQLAKHDGLEWSLVQLLVNSRACDVVFA